MARPEKKPEERKSKTLRIPVTESQKNLVEKAANAAGEDMARWARDILLRFAEEQISAKKRRRTQRKAG